ncbi:hypothetical protein HDZ31DRAFT_34158, partial [Schizophyllum fasciatum]
KITGASGYIAFSVVLELLKLGYRVRGSARGARVDTLKSVLAQYPQFEAVEVTDIVSSDLSDAFKGERTYTSFIYHQAGVDQLIHMAAPLVGRATPQEAILTSIKVGVHGTVNVLNHAVAAGVKNIVLWLTVLPDFNQVTIEAASKPDADPWLAYAAEKTFTEKAVIDFASKHPDIDISIGGPIKRISMS